MKIKNLKKYTGLYKSSASMGSARILRDYIGVNVDFPIPLSISHGVDMNHCLTAMDVKSIEPIHWSCNESVHERALKVKPSIRIPHPWLMLKAKRLPKKGKGFLVIGPPPGKSNDAELLKCLKNINLKSYHLLLKDRGTKDSSRDFWVANNIHVVRAGPGDDFFYDRLFDILENYEYVIGCTLSSALFFAAAIGRKCCVIDNYTYSAYETSDYLKVIDFNSPMAKEFTRLLKSHDYPATSNMALNVLGNDFLIEPSDLKFNLCSAFKDLENPVHFGPGLSSLEKKILLFISNLFERSELIKFGPSSYIKRKMRADVSLIKINEIDVWLNGLNNNNFEIRLIKYIKGLTEPGWAVD